MGFFGLLWFLLIGALAGWLAGKVGRGSGMGFLANMAGGVVGARGGGVWPGTAGYSSSRLPQPGRAPWLTLGLDL